MQLIILGNEKKRLSLQFLLSRGVNWQTKRKKSLKSTEFDHHNQDILKLTNRNKDIETYNEWRN